MMRRGVGMIAVALPVALAMSACGSDDSGGGDDTLLVWTVEDTADRVQAQEKLLAEFSEKTGVKTKLVAVAEGQLTTVLISAAAAGELPDVIGALSLPIVNQLRTDDLLDTDAAAEVVDALGADTFAERALTLTRDGETQLAVPSDGWAQLLSTARISSTQAGLEPPTSYDAIKTAAAAPRPGRGRRHRGQHRRQPTRSPTRPSSTSRWPTAASWSTTTATCTLDSPSASTPSSSTATSSATTRWPATRTSTPRGRPTSPVRPRW